MSKKIVVATLFAAAATLASAGVGFAQGAGGGQGNGPVATACAAEITKYCAKLSHGSGDIRACLEKNKANVSAGCKAALDNTGGGRR